VGLTDGRVLPLSIDNAAAQRKLALYDVVLVRVTEGKGKTARAELRVRPLVQGAVVVLENKTGRILAMSGGFSYPLSQLNRTTQAVRQPGSAIKPLSYLAALRRGLQPNTLISDDPITLPPIGGGRAREQDYWTPKNYDGGGGGILTLRRALENSRNLATVHLLDGGIENTPEASLDRVCKLAVEAHIYRECVRYYPFVLGAQPVRPIDLAAFYAAIANEGQRPLPHTVDSIDRDGQTIYRYQQTASGTISSVDRTAFYQLKSMMQGVLARGTARAISGLAPYVAGKTGTSDEENDAWFVGFTNDVTSRSGSATTMPAASAAPSAAAPPAAASPFRSSSRSSRRCGPMSRQKPRLPRHRRKPNASSAASRSTWSRAKCKAAAEKRFRNASGWMLKAGSSIRSIGWCRARTPAPSANARQAPPGQSAMTPLLAPATSAPTPTRIGRAIPGARRRSGVRAGIMASGVASNKGTGGAPTPAPSGTTNADRSNDLRARPAYRKMIAAHAIAGGDIKRKQSAGNRVIPGRCPLVRRTKSGAGR
jgi:membrane peptidoglycan carboxypeptidase